TDRPCHSPLVPAPCSACPGLPAATWALPLGIVVLPAPNSFSASYKREQFLALARAERPLLTPPRVRS
ncbi:MAG: hypothetical protein EBS97_06915, partial [Verrucomicrobia bacterium]|nr:hypothetical protein [Verrucomicrobiota bacterium]